MEILASVTVGLRVSTATVFVLSATIVVPAASLNPDMLYVPVASSLSSTNVNVPVHCVSLVSHVVPVMV